MLYLDASALVKRYAEEAGSELVVHAMDAAMPDALHLAPALLLPAENLTAATWDVRLHRAARDQGLATLPTALD
jgi:predicted nucleic acid-binding protein